MHSQQRAGAVVAPARAYVVAVLPARSDAGPASPCKWGYSVAAVVVAAGVFTMLDVAGSMQTCRLTPAVDAAQARSNGVVHRPSKTEVRCTTLLARHRLPAYGWGCSWCHGYPCVPAARIRCWSRAGGVCPP